MLSRNILNLNGLGAARSEHYANTLATNMLMNLPFCAGTRGWM